MVENTFEKALEYLKNKEDKKAYDIFEKLAKEDDVEAQIRLGYLLFLGSSSMIKKDIDKAMYWFNIAKDNSSEAERMLGFCFLEKGHKEKGILFLENAFNRKNRVATLDLGDIYDFGKYGIEEDKEQALYYYMQGCKLKDYEGCKNMLLLLKELQINHYEYVKNNFGIFRFIIYWIPRCVIKKISFPSLRRFLS